MSLWPDFTAMKGTTPAQVEALKASVLRLACPDAVARVVAWREAGATDEEIAEASALASETAFSIDDWLAALRRIGDYLKCTDSGPAREVIVRLIRDICGPLAERPQAAAWMLLGDEATPGVFGPWGQQSRSAASPGTAYDVAVRPETIARMEAAARGHRP